MRSDPKRDAVPETIRRRQREMLDAIVTRPKCVVCRGEIHEGDMVFRSSVPDILKHEVCPDTKETERNE